MAEWIACERFVVLAQLMVHPPLALKPVGGVNQSKTENTSGPQNGNIFKTKI